jgi:hypothetical protein
MSTPHSFFVTAARGLVPLLADELVALGARVVRPAPGGVRVRGPLSFGYRLCLWSRTASRVILHLADFPVDGTDALYAGVHELAWEDHVAPSGTIAVDVVASGEVITHSQFAARRVKDAVVDRLRARFGERPSVDLQQPDVRISVYVRGRGCSVGIDLAGESLHRRHWRGDHGPAPLKETLAAGLLLRGGWPARAAQRLRGAIARAPFMVAGTGRFDTRVMEALGERVCCKVGAEGVYCAALPERGWGVAIKVDDGNNARAAEVAMAAVIEAALRLDTEAAGLLRSLSELTLRNWNGRVVGQLRASATLRDALAGLAAPR